MFLWKIIFLENYSNRSVMNSHISDTQGNTVYTRYSSWITRNVYFCFLHDFGANICIVYKFKSPSICDHGNFYNCFWVFFLYFLICDAKNYQIPSTQIKILLVPETVSDLIIFKHLTMPQKHCRQEKLIFCHCATSLTLGSETMS